MKTRQEGDERLKMSKREGRKVEDEAKRTEEVDRLRMIVTEEDEILKMNKREVEGKTNRRLKG